MKPIIFLDMDSVIVNWTDPVAKYLDLDIDGSIPREVSKLTTESQQKEIDELMESYLFWISLKPFSWSEALIKRVSEMGELYFLSKARPNSPCFGGKIDWIKKYFPTYKDRLIVTSKDKFVCACPNNFLIDDDDRHKLLWEKRGGKFFHWQEIRQKDFCDSEFKKRLVGIQLLVDTYKHGL